MGYSAVCRHGANITTESTRDLNNPPHPDECRYHGCDSGNYDADFCSACAIIFVQCCFCLKCAIHGNVGIDVISAVQHELGRRTTTSSCADFHALRAGSCLQSVRQFLQFVVEPPHNIYFLLCRVQNVGCRRACRQLKW